MIKVADYNTLRIDRFVEIGAYLDDGDKGILLPKRFVPENVDIGDEIEVFVYYDSENRLIATTQKSFAKVEEIAFLKVVTTTNQGAFLDWGLMKDLFVPKSKQKSTMYKDEYYFVKIYIDEQTGRAAAQEVSDAIMQNETLTVKELEPVHIRIYRESNIGYVCIVNHQHEGLLHYADVFKKLYIGDAFEGFVKKIYADTNKLDIVLGKAGYKKVEDETEKILRLLIENDGYLPYHDKSLPEEIYDYFGMSKKVFKMTIGNLYKSKKIEMTQTGIKLV
jgi:predicted RNA-binding protein (virulence factor B family)